ncbi:LPXTG cell wall anchor domain-containing protein [Kitasatospora herbaricolor]|uniref:LPXTG cell wall anchor domain-containing protein n=1 Tax=Kitasatospora herbaricolor TaxID=68217 RepID=UPI0036DA4135
MRASGISAFTKNVPSLSRRGRAAGLAATVLLAGGVQLLGTGSAWACGAPDDSTASPAVTAPAEHHGDAVTTFGAPVPTSITAGGGKIEFTASSVNRTGAGYDDFKQLITINAADPSRGEIRTGDLTVEVRLANGSWKPLPVVRYCDPGNWADTSSLAKPLPDGGSTQFRYRIGLSAGTDPAVDQLIIGGDSDADITVPIKRTAATPTHSPTQAPTQAATVAPGSTPTAPATTATPTASAATTPPATTPPAATGAPEATATATAAPAELAHTGGSRSTGPLIGAGGALVLLGAGGLLVARRRARR